MRNVDSCKLNNNSYIKIDLAKIYVDYTNSRVKIIDFKDISVQNLKRIIHFASKNHLGKVICNCDINSFRNFVDAKFQLEGKIDGYFKGQDAFCMSYFISSNRKLRKNSSKENLYLSQSLEKNDTFSYNDDSKYCIRNAQESDVKQMAELFSNIFFTYPSPVYDEEYIRQTMKEKVLYKVAIDNGKVISVASADMDKDNLNAEITDCATYPKYRGKGILSNVIYSLESDLKDRGFITLYSLSRAINSSINFVLSKHGYKFRGTLINNCNICGGFEDMNIWVKKILI
ncbi:putative beta-lysine N-acetyltransferase [Clostridium sp. DJ247]|uniref:putative beta-lysine N-acetyltransferase n=1 Tax=Clostridium sp. DJ247 TaxID=2726188 RepID=UPI001623C1DE|nr:putative beta-lysine N-acetyltransferase [Clostridium sp. DJ247]MBC2582511.1 putative beta-lysine N-acetyltransferase [Clostridium sp. DJ247]